MIMRSSVLLLALVGLVGLFGLSLLGPPHGCPGSVTRTLTIVYSPAGIHVSPPTKTVQPGQILRFNLFGTTGKMVEVKKKLTDPAAFWISGSGKNLKFYVCVPDGQADGDYHYMVEAEGSPPYDPVVRIRTF